MIRKILICIALVASLPAQADSPETANGYSYAEVSGRFLIFDEDIRVGDYEYRGLPGIGGALSIQFLPYAFGFVEAEGYHGEEGSTELQGGYLRAGFGGAYPVTDYADALATLAYSSQTVKACDSGFCRKVDADGFTPGVGIRVALNEKVDVLAKFERDFIETDLPGGQTSEDDYSNLIFELHVSDKSHGLVIGGELQDGDAVAKIGYRYSFR